MADYREGRLWAISDLHVAYAENRRLVDEAAARRRRRLADRRRRRRARSSTTSSGRSACCAERFAQGGLGAGQPRAVDAPGGPGASCAARPATSTWSRCAGGSAWSRPRTPYPVWAGPGGPVTRRAAVPALRLLASGRTARPPRRRRWRTRTRPAWSAPTSSCCTPTRTRAGRPGAGPGGAHRAPARRLRRRACRPVLSTTTRWSGTRPRCCGYPEFAQWCGTERTADWHLRFRAAAVVYGHLHIPRTTWHDGVRFEEVSLGYPREWSSARCAAAAAHVLPGRRSSRTRCAASRVIADRCCAAGGGRGGVRRRCPASRCSRRRRRWWRRRWTSAGASSPPPAAAPARPWPSSGCRRRRCCPGAKREPLWPAGVVGSITHCDGYRAAAVARATDLATVGIDAEPHEPLPDGVLAAIALPAEPPRAARARRPTRGSTGTGCSSAPRSPSTRRGSR